MIALAIAPQLHELLDVALEIMGQAWDACCTGVLVVAVVVGLTVGFAYRKWR